MKFAWILRGAAVVACLCAAPVAAAEPGAAREGALAGLFAQQQSPEQAARGFLKQAVEYGNASAKMAEKGDVRAVDGFYASAEAAWNAVWTCPGSRPILEEASCLYAAALEGLLVTADSHGRLSGNGLVIGPAWKPICVPIETRALPVDASAIERVVARPPAGDRRLKRQHVRGGFGLPVAVRLARGSSGGGDEFTPPRQSLAATAVLRFKMPGDENFLQKFSGPLARDHAPAILDLANPVEIAAVHVGPARPLLAADLSLPLLDMLEGMPKTSSIEGFLQPYGRGDTVPKLEFLEPHQPGRIPVVFIHGLASDEGTWFDLINELRTWPTFHRRYEAWVFHYPTGATFLASAAVLRRELRTAVQRLDPQGTDRALQNMVLVGHSMGGLHAKLQVVDSSTKLWDAISYVPFEQIVLRPELKERVRANYFFEPLPFVKRVVFIATPHAGSSLASRGVGRIAALTVQQPPESKAIHDEAVTMNPDAFHSDYQRSLPTTIDILEPDSSILGALRELRTPCWVTTHSIIGTAHQSLVSGPDDCVVPASSARLPGVTSELEVPATHTRVHHHPQTVMEIERILLEHLNETR
jgi:hypothetical protein